MTRQRAPVPPAPSPDAACIHPIPRPVVGPPPATLLHPVEGKGRRCGINGVPAVVVEGKWLISGGQPAGMFEEALQGMAGEA